MSNREKVIALLDTIPEYKIGYVLAYVQGLAAHKVGTLTNANGLKTDEYGKWFADKPAHSSKEVQSFRYYDNIVPVLREMV